MTNEQFLQYMQKIFNELLELQKLKANEYTVRNFDENFEVASKLLNIDKETVALSYLTKHIVSIYDCILHKRNYDKLHEKITDAILYLIIIDALTKQKQ